MTKSLYIIDYWVPFPQSEYGGIITLIADDDSDAFNILSEEESIKQYEEYNHLIMQKILTSQKFKLSSDYEDYQSGLLEVFVT